MPIPVQYVKFKSRRRFGVEMEVNEKIPLVEIAKVVQTTDPKRQVASSGAYVHTPGNNKYWHVKFDRSCSDVPRRGGSEVASYVTSGHKGILAIAAMAKALKNAGAVVNNHCAFHVHGQADDFTRDQIATMIAYWSKMEHIIYAMVPRHRRVSIHAKSWMKKIKARYTEETKFTTTSFWRVIHPVSFDHTERRMSLNICGYISGDSPNGYRENWQPTVELRIPEGTLNPRDIKNWIRFYICFLDHVKEKPFPETVKSFSLVEMLNLLGLHNENPFLILSEGLRNTKMWVLGRIVRHSSNRSLQDEAKEILDNMTAPEEENSAKEPILL